MDLEEGRVGWEEERVMGWPPAMDRGWGVGVVEDGVGVRGREAG